MRRTHLKAKETLKFTVNTAHFNILGNFVLILSKASGIGYMVLQLIITPTYFA